MEKLAQLRAKRGEVMDEAGKLAANDNYDPTAFDAKMAELDRIDHQIKALERAQAAQAAAARPLSGQKGVIDPKQYRRSHKLKNFKGDAAVERAHQFGHFCLATMYGSAKSIAWCNDNGIVLQKDHSEGSAAAGGYFVPEELSLDIIDLRDEYGRFRRLCRVWPMGRDTMNVPARVSGLTANPVGEAVAGATSTAAWRNVQLTARKWMVLTLFSSELDEDAVINIGDNLVGEIAYAFAVAEDAAGFTGDGTGTYHGIKGFTKLFADGVGVLKGAVDATSGHDLFTEVDSTDLNKVMGTLPQYVYERGDPRWYISQMGWANVFQRLVLASGGITKDDITGRVTFMFAGFPVEIIPNLPNVLTAINDTPMALFGDIAMGAAFGDRRGVTIARSTEYKFAEDQVALKGTERFDINIHSIGDASNAGPVVALMGNT